MVVAVLGCGPKKPAEDAANVPKGEVASTPNAPMAIEGGAKQSCANVRCAAGTRCELVQVQCVAAPCDPVPECKPDPTAGGHVSCGKNTCAAGQVCCNASCGICTDPGMMCIQMACPPQQ